VSKTQTQNIEGKWVPAIPVPIFAMFGYRCHCGMFFFRKKAYRGHYALIHILKLEAR